MVRSVLIRAGVLILIFGLTVAPVAGPITTASAQTAETEPNDDFETADEVGEANISAGISGGESDYYRINANTTDALSLEVSNMKGGAAVEIRLYNSDRDELESDFRNRGSDLSITRKLPETGTYYVEIDGTRSQTTTEYTLQSSQTGEFPNPDSQPELSATVQQAGSPGGQARVQYTLSNVSGQSSVAIEFTNLPSQVSVNTSASTTTGTFGQNNQQVVFVQPNSELTATIAFDIAASVSTDTTFDIETAALNQNSTTTDSVTTTVGGAPVGPIERFDADGNGEIDLIEVQAAIRAFSNGELDLQGVQQVIGAFSS
jgi:hypothetical protein